MAYDHRRMSAPPSWGKSEGMDKTTKTRSLALLLALAGSASTFWGATATASASGKGDGEVVKRGSCSAGAAWKLKAKPDDGGLQVEFEVDSNRAGQTWTVRINDNG